MFSEVNLKTFSNNIKIVSSQQRKKYNSSRKKSLYHVYHCYCVT